MPIFDLSLPWLLGEPESAAVIRHTPEDFQVEEVLGFEPEGEGEHLFVQLRKRGDNTAWVARQLARIAGLPPGAVSYSGLKDRWAVTTQWFSLHLPGREDPDLAPLQALGVELLQQARHRRKLKVGAHRGNRFRIRLRELDAPESLAPRLQAVAARGVPNYFGEQRFGHAGGNLHEALAMFQTGRRVRNRTQRGLYLSAARAWLFNRVVAARVEKGSLERGLDGEPWMLDGRHSLFRAPLDETVRRRLGALEIHPTAPLWGRGPGAADGDCAECEAGILSDWHDWCQGLERAGLKQERRAARLRVASLAGEALASDQWQLSFYLPAGAFATSVLREVCNYSVASPPSEATSSEGRE